MLELIDAYFRHLNDENWEELAMLFAPEATYRATGSRPRSGVGDVMDFFKHAFRAWDIHLDTPVNVMTGDNCASVEVALNGTTRPDGRAITFDAVDVFHFRNGRVTAASTWYDLLAVRKSLGWTA